jgi:hypothetical protein
MRQLQMQQDNRNNQQFINQLNNPITSNQNYSNQMNQVHNQANFNQKLMQDSKNINRQIYEK